MSNNDPLHGITLQMILTRLVKKYGWKRMSKAVHINCFSNEPSVKSSLKFLRKTDWARKEVEALYLQAMQSDDTIWGKKEAADKSPPSSNRGAQ